MGLQRTRDKRKKHYLFRTNLLISLIIVLSFAAVILVDYQWNSASYEKEVERVALLTSDSIYYQVENAFAEPVSVSLTMGHDTLLKEMLEGEPVELEPSFLSQIQAYLDAYRIRYEYDSVFLVSVKTGHYYHFRGLDRILTKDNPENVWYYEFLQSPEEYSLNIDNDEASEDTITVFVNCKITGKDGSLLGVVGVGLQVENIQGLLESYAQQIDGSIQLVDEAGFVQLSSQEAGEDRADILDNPQYAVYQERFWQEPEVLSFWNAQRRHEDFTVVRYIPSLKWALMVGNSTDELWDQFQRQLLMTVLIAMAVVAIMLVVVNRIITKYNKVVIQKTVSQEMEYQSLLHSATQAMYESVLELDITHNCAGGLSTQAFFRSLGIEPGEPYSEALKVIAEKQIMEPFIPGYLETFSRENILDSFAKSINELYYDMMITKDGENYYWLRIRAQIFYWDSDQSVRMITYRQNIDQERRKEEEMREMAWRDALTGLYNKTATALKIDQKLAAGADASHALIMLDIDRFKEINDTLGHATGDTVIQTLAKKLTTTFRATDICGRIGGDEFVVFLSNIPSQEWVQKEAEALLDSLRGEAGPEGQRMPISVSMGIVLAQGNEKKFADLYKEVDEALYRSKAQGRDRYSFY